MKSYNKQVKRHLFIYAAIALAMCVIIASSLLSSVFARYSTGGSGDAVATISNYYVKATLAAKGTPTQTVEQFSISTSGNEEYCITITNEGSVSVAYKITLTNETCNLPLTLTLTEGSTNTATSTTSATLSSSAALTTDASGNTATVGIKISLTTDTEEYNSLYREIDRVSVTIVCTQAS